MQQKGFTLIELLIVVAIIAILAAIAIPNFLEAQTRAKTSRVKNDMRTIALACEAYRVDNNKFPCYLGVWDEHSLWSEYMFNLTTPVSYLTSMSFRDPFTPSDIQATNIAWTWIPEGSIGSYFYIELGLANQPRSWGYGRYTQMPDVYTPLDAVQIASYGPDRTFGQNPMCLYDTSTTPWTVRYPGTPNVIYDPTNGTISFGDIMRWAGNAPAISTP